MNPFIFLPNFSPWILLYFSCCCLGTGLPNPRLSPTQEQISVCFWFCPLRLLTLRNALRECLGHAHAACIYTANIYTYMHSIAHLWCSPCCYGGGQSRKNRAPGANKTLTSPPSHLLSGLFALQACSVLTGELFAPLLRAPEPRVALRAVPAEMFPLLWAVRLVRHWSPRPLQQRTASSMTSVLRLLLRAH